MICQRKKKSSAIVFMLVLLLSASIATLFAGLALANPMYIESISPPIDVKPSIISFNPKINNTVHNQNTIFLTLNVSIPKTEALSKYILSISYIQFQRSWNDTVIDFRDWGGSGKLITDFSGNLTLMDIPEGSHNVTFKANLHGGYSEEVTSYIFDIASYSTIYFSVDTISPGVSVLSLENAQYEVSNIPLNFTVNEKVTKTTYSLDGLDNVTVAGNTTLSGLSVGEHTVTVYAWDEAGNVSASETLYFTVEETEPSPVPLILASIGAISVIGIVLLVHFKKRKH